MSKDSAIAPPPGPQSQRYLLKKKKNVHVYKKTWMGILIEELLVRKKKGEMRNDLTK